MQGFIKDTCLLVAASSSDSPQSGNMQYRHACVCVPACVYACACVHVYADTRRDAARKPLMASFDAIRYLSHPPTTTAGASPFGFTLPEVERYGAEQKAETDRLSKEAQSSHGACTAVQDKLDGFGQVGMQRHIQICYHSFSIQ